MSSQNTKGFRLWNCFPFEQNHWRNGLTPTSAIKHTSAWLLELKVNALAIVTLIISNGYQFNTLIHFIYTFRILAWQSSTLAFCNVRSMRSAHINSQISLFVVKASQQRDSVRLCWLMTHTPPPPTPVLRFQLNTGNQRSFHDRFFICIGFDRNE